MLIYSRDAPFHVEVHALSPSAQTITDAKGKIAELIPQWGDSIRRFPCLGPNDLSVVLHIKTIGPNLLLGADLERGRDQRRGWQAILASELRVHAVSDAYKVAHHGSAGADLDAIWMELLGKAPLAVLTPYARGRKPLPAPEDVDRIKSKTHWAYCTVYPSTIRPPRRRGVDRTMSEVTRTRHATRTQPGQIRLRVPLAGGPRGMSVELFDGAKQL